MQADNYTSKEYVGFVDTDCFFLTYIDREDLFEEGKPVINGRTGYHDPEDVWAQMPLGTYVFTVLPFFYQICQILPFVRYLTLGMNETFRCMSYFPVIVKTAHLKPMREFISRYHNEDFDIVFYKNISTRPYSQFGIMCTYLFAFHRGVIISLLFFQNVYLI